MGFSKGKKGEPCLEGGGHCYSSAEQGWQQHKHWWQQQEQGSRLVVKDQREALDKRDAWWGLGMGKKAGSLLSVLKGRPMLQLQGLGCRHQVAGSKSTDGRSWVAGSAAEAREVTATYSVIVACIIIYDGSSTPSAVPLWRRSVYHTLVCIRCITAWKRIPTERCMLFPVLPPKGGERYAMVVKFYALNTLWARPAPSICC